MPKKKKKNEKLTRIITKIQDVIEILCKKIICLKALFDSRKRFI